MALFYLMRHDEADYALAEKRRLIGGAREWVPLTAKGQEQVRLAARDLRLGSIDLILSSPHTRALQSAAILSRLLNRPLAVEFDLHEWLPDMSYQYKSMKSILNSFEEMVRHNGEWPDGQELPWEPLSHVRERALQVLGKYANGVPKLVVCHSTVIQALTSIGEFNLVPSAELVEFTLPDNDEMVTQTKTG